MNADYSFEVKNIEIWAPAFFKHNNSSVATVDMNNRVESKEGVKTYFSAFDS